MIQMQTVVQIKHAAMKAYISRRAFKTQAAYDRQLWNAALDFFRDETDAFGFIDDMTASIENQLTRAWNDGARKVGTDPRDMSDADLMELENIIQNENDFVLGVAEDIEEARIQGMTLDSFRARFRSRMQIWSNRYNDVVNQAKLYFGGKVKLKWVLGATEQHCQTCAMLNGIVAYAEEWDEAGVFPQRPPNDVLECGGWKCDCNLEETTERRSANALQRIIDIAVSQKI